MVVSPTPGEPKIGGKVRAAGVALALGLIVSLCSAFVIESFMQRRKRSVTDLDLDLAPPAREPALAVHAPPPAPRPQPQDAEATVRVQALTRPTPGRRPSPVSRPPLTPPGTDNHERPANVTNGRAS